jgi:hypothetical protein
MEIAASVEESSQAGLVLASRLDDLTAFFYDQFPNKRPHSKDCDCDTCHRCHNSGCNRPRCVVARIPIKAARVRREPSLRYHEAAARAGMNAANSADLGQTKVAGNKGVLNG